MMRFNAAAFTQAVSNLETARNILGDPRDELDEHGELKVRQVVMDRMKNLATEFERSPTSKSLRSQVSRFIASVPTEPFSSLAIVLNEIRYNLVSELREQLFLCVPAIDRSLFVKPEDYWSVPLLDSYPDATDDLNGATKCLALGMWTASVFHSMRAVQHGLRRLSDRYAVVFSKDFDVLNWGQIIKELDKTLKALEQRPKTPARDAELEFGARASSHFFAIKEAWRNYVMHGRSTYDEEQARSIAGNVRSIMLALV